MILTNNIPLKKVIQLPLLKGLNCILAKDIYTSINMPPFRQSAMDGYALNIHDSLTYNIMGEVKAGDATKFELKQGEAVKISTGAAVPDSANTVIQVEKTTCKNEKLILNEHAAENKNIRAIGEQIEANKIALSQETV